MNKKYIFIGIGVVLIALVLIFPNLPKRFLKQLINDYEDEYKAKVRQLDSIQNIRVKDSINYADALHIKDSELNEIQNRLDNANSKIRYYEKELHDYRNGNFNERFGKFTDLITVTDSL